MRGLRRILDDALQLYTNKLYLLPVAIPFVTSGSGRRRGKKHTGLPVGSSHAHQEHSLISVEMALPLGACAQFFLAAVLIDRCQNIRRPDVRVRRQ